MIDYGFGKTRFGSAFIALENDLVLQLSFVSTSAAAKELKKLRRRWPQTEISAKSASWAQAQLDKLLPQTPGKQTPSLPKMTLNGTDFQKKVWKALMRVPLGKTTTYSEIAKQIGHPKAVRAVGSAVGANPIGYLIPCHRVLPKAGGIGQFGWGPELKKKMLQFENAV